MKLHTQKNVNCWNPLKSSKLQRRFEIKPSVNVTKVERIT
nr:hypothetical protein DGKKSRWO_DGKKSRWO_CDS_0136 [uncultured phage]CAI9752313.1 hypothetical protein CVNMHQAP_CVNMHQAP_CDS_0136 [uncultured phage]